MIKSKLDSPHENYSILSKLYELSHSSSSSSSNNVSKMSVEGFREHVRRETNNLTNLCRYFEGVVKEKQDLPEDISGDIMVAVG